MNTLNFENYSQILNEVSKSYKLYEDDDTRYSLLKSNFSDNDETKKTHLATLKKTQNTLLGRLVYMISGNSKLCSKITLNLSKFFSRIDKEVKNQKDLKEKIKNCESNNNNLEKEIEKLKTSLINFREQLFQASDNFIKKGLFDSKFDQLPIIKYDDLSIDSKLSSPMMRGKDKNEREFFVIKVQNLKTNEWSHKVYIRGTKLSNLMAPSDYNQYNQYMMSNPYGIIGEAGKCDWFENNMKPSTLIAKPKINTEDEDGNHFASTLITKGKINTVACNNLYKLLSEGQNDEYRLIK